MGAKLIMLGPPGAGKGTQAVRLSKALSAPQVSTGDMLRAARREGSSLGQKAAEYMDAGNLVPDEVVIGIVDDRLKRPGVDAYILDGFPRTVEQAEALERLGHSLDAVVLVKVPEDLLVDRITGRMSCACGATYHRRTRPPKQEGVCDACGAELRVRDDDTEEVVRERLRIYMKHTAPLIAFYEAKGLLRTVDGVGSMDEVFERILEAIGVQQDA